MESPLDARRLSDRVFHDIFPHLTRAVAAAAPMAPLADVRDAAVVALYRLLFALRAKDRDVALNGAPDTGQPPCDLFDPQRAPLLAAISLGDDVMADAFDALSFEQTPAGPVAIDYRALSIQQIGGIYERLLELELVRDGADVVVRPDVAERRTSGSYYTPDDLVALVIRETVGPLMADRTEAFRAKPDPHLDPASAMLDLKICDPAMGAGHFLVSLVDFLADEIIAAMAGAEAGEGYVSPLRARIHAARLATVRGAGARGLAIDPGQLDDRAIVRRMVAARCVYGVDKNPLAVELAKAALQLHTFIPGAPPVFLDHHLRCGDSLFGLWVRTGVEKASTIGAAVAMEDALAQAGTAPLDALLSRLFAFEWLGVRDEDAARRLIAEERFFNWEAAFPEVWPDSLRWKKAAGASRSVDEESPAFAHPRGPGGPGGSGGFDAVIGNPPWDRVKLQQVEWFAARRRDIAMAPRAADRARMIAALQASGEPLAQDYAKASARAEAAARMARTCGDYPLLSAGDVNLYSLFVERAMALVNPRGLVGLLVPSGIASDKTASRFFKDIATSGRLRALYDFENRRGPREPFFPDVDGRFKFCAFVASPSPSDLPARCAFFLQDVAELTDPERCFPLMAQDFACVNPNTGTAPLFRTRGDADLAMGIYRRIPVLADHSAEREARPWPVRYTTMFHMTNDSHLFRTRAELTGRENAHPVGGNRWLGESGLWLPLYEGKMAQAFDHRAASVAVNPQNRHRPAQPEPAALAQHQDPAWLPQPQYFVEASRCGWAADETWVLGFKEITSPTNGRTFVAALFPAVGFGNKVPLLRATSGERRTHLLCANLNSIIFDYIVRQKIQGQTLNRFIVEQLPVIPPAHYDRRFGAVTAAEIVADAVLELTYTSHDMAPFALDMGYADRAGAVRPPFAWNEKRRAMLRAKLDALYFHLYGVNNRDDVRYIYSTFPIVERVETARHGRYLSRDLCLELMDAL